MKIYAHRGNKSEYPENSLAAFQSAVELGVEGIELDVHWSKDNEMDSRSLDGSWCELYCTTCI